MRRAAQMLKDQKFTEAADRLLKVGRDLWSLPETVR